MIKCAMFVRRSFFILAGLGIASGCFGGVLMTTDGERYDGEIKKTDAGWSITAPNGHVDTVTADRVKRRREALVPGSSTGRRGGSATGSSGRRMRPTIT